MLKTTEPVIIMTRSELEAVIERAARKAVAEVIAILQADKVANIAEASTADVDRLLRMPQVLDRVGLKKTVIYERIKAGTFPKPIKLGSASAWLENEIESWIAQQG